MQLIDQGRHHINDVDSAFSSANLKKNTSTNFHKSSQNGAQLTDPQTQTNYNRRFCDFQSKTKRQAAVRNV